MWTDGLTCGINNTIMGSCAEETMSKYGITREMSDEFCIASYERAQAAWNSGWFYDEVVEIEGKNPVK